MATFALSASAQSSRQIRPYSFNKKGVFYGRQPVMGIDPRTFVDLGYGYAKDRYNVYFEGQILPFVDPLTFRLKVPGRVYPGDYPLQREERPFKKTEEYNTKRKEIEAKRFGL